MDWLEFFAALLAAVSWPIAVVMIVVLLRAEISKILPALTKIKAGPIEAEFSREAEKLREIADSPGSALPQIGSRIPAQEELLSMVEVSPRAAIIEAWRRVELSFHRLAVFKGIPGSLNDQSSAALIRFLSGMNILNGEQLRILGELRQLRNEAAHKDDFVPSKVAAINYIDVATRFRLELERLSGGL